MPLTSCLINTDLLLFLRFFEDLKIDEIAEVMDENVNTVKTRLYAALKKLRIEVGEEFRL